MAQMFFRTPFATSGDTTDVPNDAQPDGSVSYTDGFGPDYQADPMDPDVLYPERPIINDLFKVITGALQILQVHGFPDFITSADNDGSPYSYDMNAWVRYSDGNVYYSLVNSNTALPTDNTKWAMFAAPQAFQTGDMLMWEDTTLRSGGWIWANGTTVGSASSGATGRANADTADLFAQIWRVFPNSIRPIQDSSGAASTRGVSAAADFAANKRLPTRDMRGNVPAGWTTMGGVSASGNLSTANGLGVDGSVLGATGGEGLGHTPTTAETASHTHNGTGMTTNTAGLHSHNLQTASGSGANSYIGVDAQAPLGSTATDTSGLHSHTISGNTQSTGSGQAFNVVQPTTICNFIVKL